MPFEMQWSVDSGQWSVDSGQWLVKTEGQIALP